MSAGRLLPLAVAAALTSCALLARKTPPAIQYYVLAVPGAPAARLPMPIEVGPFTADQPYATERIAYRTSPYRIDYYVYNRWAADPRSMIAAAARDYLDRAAPPDGRPPAELVAHIRRIEEVDEPGGARRGDLALDVKVVQDGHVLLARDFSESEPAEGANIEAVVAALSRALGRILDQVAVALATPAAGEKPRPRGGSDAPK